MRFKITLLLISLLLLFSCDFFFEHNPYGPDDPVDPWQYGGEIEIMYVRVKEVVDPSAPDLTKNAASVYHNKYGWLTSSYWVVVGENRWTAVISLSCDFQSYFIVVEDYQLGINNKNVGEKIFLRRKGDMDWLELTCVVDAVGGPIGKAAKFVFNNGKIQNPNPSGC